MPTKYRNEIVEHLMKSNMELNEEHQYKIVVDLLGDFQKRLRKEMEMIKQGGALLTQCGNDPSAHPASHLVKELVGNNPRLEGLNHTAALT